MLKISSRPNTITFVGLMINCLPGVWMIYQYGYELEGPISANMCYTIGISYQMYIICDNCDGK